MVEIRKISFEKLASAKSLMNEPNNNRKQEKN